MDGGTDNRRSRALMVLACARQQWRLGLVLALTLACTACNATSSNTAAPALGATSGAGPTVAFESVDGPPESIYAKLVQSLSEEASAQNIPVVSRGAPAHYRVRVYAATVVYPKRSVLYWVWDVYDAEQRRAFRLTGEEPITGAGRTTWAIADDPVIRKIAHTGMDRLVAYLKSPRRPPPPAAPPLESAPAVAMAAEH